MKTKERFEQLEMEVVSWSNEEILMSNTDPSIQETDVEDPFG